MMKRKWRLVLEVKKRGTEERETFDVYVEHGDTNVITVNEFESFDFGYNNDFEAFFSDSKVGPNDKVVVAFNGDKEGSDQDSEDDSDFDPADEECVDDLDDIKDYKLIVDVDDEVGYDLNED
ncbi:hypothetical protein QVD17_30332 [Tagetes erecta]|uniref:Uncharacterized protein n=1 Tax=Tagetes erecta TaxID=13708 RepID=A0AAD8NFX4_TARER|nr:hypothetical protein QVD17_30332 [Tagetes erecta]